MFRNRKFKKEKIVKPLVIIIGAVILVILLGYTLIIQSGKNNFLKFGDKTQEKTISSEDKNFIHESTNTLIINDVEKVNSLATVKNVLSDNLFELTLVNGTDITVTVNNSTLIGRYWEKQDKDGNIRTSYNELELNSLGEIVKGDTIMVTYNIETEEDNYTAEEFVLY